MTCPICNRPLCQTAFGDSTDYEQRARCYKLGYERLRDEVNEYREAKEAAYAMIYKLRDLLLRSLDVISPYDTTLWPEIHRAVHPAPSTKP